MVAFAKVYPKVHTPDRSAKDSGLRYYSPEISRWLSRDPIGESGGGNRYAFALNSPTYLFDPDGRMVAFAGWEQKGTSWISWYQVEGDPSGYTTIGFVHRTGTYDIDRCNVVILAGHGSILPYEMRVSEEDRGCAFGMAYGCVAGGGAFASPDPSNPWIIYADPVLSPGIPGAPEQSVGVAVADEIMSDGGLAFSAAIQTIDVLCGSRCCCEEVEIRVNCLGTIQDLADYHPLEYYLSLGYSPSHAAQVHALDLANLNAMTEFCSMSVTVTCP